MENLNEYNRLLEKNYKGKYIPAPGFVAFYCAVLRREVIDKVGFLDEVFGMGLYDDCDYCEEATAQGFPLAVALDTMIWHKSNATFEKHIDPKEFDQALADNAVLYREREKERKARFR